MLFVCCRVSYFVNMLSELRSVLSVMHGFFLVLLFYSNGFSCMVSIILHCVILILVHNSLLTFFVISSLVHCFLCISPSFSFLSISAPPTQKRFYLFRSKSQDKLLSPPSSAPPTSSRPRLSLPRKVRFWSSSDITADSITNQPMSASGKF